MAENQRFQKWLYILIIFVAIWVGLAETVFQFRHPEYTDTQRLLKIKDALLFR